MLVLERPTATQVRKRWARAAELGLQRESDAYPVGISDSELDDRRERLSDVLREERSLLEPIASQLVTGPLVAIVADRDGVILSAHSERGAMNRMAQVRLVEGARWGEETRGTNAIGTALAEGGAVSVIGKAHFETRNHDLFCCATPIRDAFGEIVAVLDVTGAMPSYDPSWALTVQAAGSALERALRGAAYVDPRTGSLAAIERLVHRASGATMLLEASGLARVVNAAARATITSGAEQIGCEQLFGVHFSELCSAAAARGGMRFEAHGRAFRVGLDPITGVGGRTLAALVHFEPERSAPARVSEPPSRPAAAPAPVQAPELASILGRDAELLRAKQLSERFARTTLPVLLLAETGTGKELFARAIHATSPVKSGPFVAVNCGALSPELMLSELFGYAPGAFTGALRNGSDGRVGAAHGGTLFLDEIAEMSEALQAALLRVLDSGVYQRVGETREQRAEFRLICATCRNLPALVAEGKFRRDLFYRIQGARVTLPALRDRHDKLWLAEQLLERLEPGSAARLEPEARRMIEAHDWPGNVRELKSALAHALALSADEPAIRTEHFPLPLEDMPAPRSTSRAENPMTRQRIVRDAIEATLRACAGNVSEAARRLGVGRGTIYRTINGNARRR